MEKRKEIDYDNIIQYIDGNYIAEFCCEVYDEAWNYIDLEYKTEEEVSENDKNESVLINILGFNDECGMSVVFKLPYCLVRKSDGTLIRAEN